MVVVLRRRDGLRSRGRPELRASLSRPPPAPVRRGRTPGPHRSLCASLGSAPAMAVIPSSSRARVCPYRVALALALVATALSSCSLFAQPKVAAVHDSSLAPPGPVGYVVCPTGPGGAS